MQATDRGTDGPDLPRDVAEASGYGGALLEAADGARARERSLEGGGGEELPLHAGRVAGRSCIEQLARAALLRGSAAEALPLRGARRLDAPTSRACCASRGLVAQRAAAEIMLFEGTPQRALRSRALDAAAGAAEVGAPIEEAISRMLAGRALAAGGRARPRRRGAVGGAAAIFETCGALPRRDAADRELGKLGQASAPAHERGKADGSGHRARSPSASSRWRGWWWTGRPTLR